MPTQRLAGPFRGIVSELPATHVPPNYASDLLNVELRDGSIRSRPGFTLVNSTPMRGKAFWDTCRSEKQITTVTDAVQVGLGSYGIVLSAVTTTGFEYYGGRMRGRKSSDVTSANRLLNAAGSATPFAGAHYAVEFALRKFQGFGYEQSSFIDGEVETTGNFSVFLRSSTADLSADVGYEVEFDIPLGMETGADQTSASGNNLNWKDLTYRILKRSSGDTGRTTLLTHTGTDEGPGVDEWIDVRVEIYGTITTTIRVLINGTLSETATDSSSPVTDANFVKIRAKTDGTTNQDKAQKRQIEIGYIFGEDLSSAGARNAAAYRIDALSFWRQQKQDSFLIAAAQSGSGSFLHQRTTETSSTTLAAFSQLGAAYAVDENGDPFVFTRLNRRNALATAVEATLTYSAGEQVFFVDDAETTFPALDDYTFAAGDRVHVIGSYIRTVCDGTSSGANLAVADETGFHVGDTVDIGAGTARHERAVVSSTSAGVLTMTVALVFVHNLAQQDIVRRINLDETNNLVVPGLYDIEAKSGSQQLRASGIPTSDGSTVATVSIVYRIVSESGHDGVLGVLQQSDAPDMAEANGWLYVADGSERAIKTDGESVHLVGIKEPETPPTLAASTLGDGGGGDTYSYKFAYYNQTQAMESSGSGKSVEVAVSTDFKITSGSFAADVTATHMRLYRQNVTGGQADWFRTQSVPLPIDSFATGPIILDRTPDGSEVETVTVPDVNDNDPPRDMALVEWREDRMWWAKANSSQIFFSASSADARLGGNAPDHVDPLGNLIWIGREDGETIKAIIQYRNQLVIFKDSSLWIVIGETANTFSVMRMASAGCSSHLAVLQASDGLLYFAGRGGIYRWNGQTVQSLHFAIQSTYFALETSAWDRMTAGHDEKFGLVYWAVRQDGSAENDRWFVLDYKTPGVQLPQGVIFNWSVYNLEGTSFATEIVENQPRVRYGRADGTVGAFRGNDGTAASDNGTGITWRYDWPKMDFGTNRQKRFEALQLDFEQASTESNISLGYRVDEETAVTASLFDQSESYRKYRKVRRRGGRIRPRVSGSATTVASRITGLDLLVDLIGYR